MTQSIVFNSDCLEAMRNMPDNAYDLAIVDPPYGIGAGGKTFINRNTANKRAESFYRDSDWDTSRPDKSYFTELLRVSKNWIVWGGNYFTDLLSPSRCFIVWDKKTGSNSYADAELALTSFDSNARIFVKLWLGAHAQDSDGRFHPTQKPVDLYKWCINNFAKRGDKILDTHLGSGSSRIAAHELGFDFTGYELDKGYYEAQEKRFQLAIQQQSLF